MIASLALVAVVVAASVALIWVPTAVVGRAQRSRCVGCLEGTVLFTDRDDPLCHDHWQRRDRIAHLEWKMDHIHPEQGLETERDVREEGLARLMEKLGANVPSDAPVKIRIAGDWVEVGRLPVVEEKEGGGG